MDGNRLVVVCGAGLSMAPPSKLPSASQVAELCFDEYRLRVEPNINPALRHDLEAFAEHFATMNALRSTFIEHIVPWKKFVRPPNAGHAAIADFLITRAAVACLSSNYDTLIERRAWDYGFDFRSALNGDEANVHATTQGPLIKFHGCSQKDRLSTIWAPSQLGDTVIEARIETIKTWLAANLRQKDLLIVGFWTDWEYLNQIIDSAFERLEPRSLTVIDSSDTDHLQHKAPRLWDLARAENVAFSHVQESAADALDELRQSFSENYLRQVIAAGQTKFQQEADVDCDADWLQIAGFDSETLYHWRRDAEGVPGGAPVTKRRPENTEVLGFFHILLRQAGAQQTDNGYEMAGRTIRVINAGGEFLDSVRTRFIEAPAVWSADVIVAVGAVDSGTPGNIVRRGRVDDFIRPVPGGEWYDMSSAREELNI